MVNHINYIHLKKFMVLLKFNSAENNVDMIRIGKIKGQFTKKTIFATNENGQND
jgi:hypothetical protein